MKKHITIVKLLFLLFFCAINTAFAEQLDCECSKDSKVLPTGIREITTNEKYCVTENTILSSLTIEKGGELIISKGKQLKITGSFNQNGGVVKVCSFAQFLITGSVILGEYGSQNDTEINLVSNAYFSVTGSLTINDPSFEGYYNKGKATIKMESLSMVEICGTMNSSVATYQIIEHIGNGTKKALIINRAQVSGNSTELTLSNKIDWITLNTVSQIKPGKSNWCGENAKSTCAYWPKRFDSTKDCGSLILPSIADERKKRMISNPMIHIYNS